MISFSSKLRRYAVALLCVLLGALAFPAFDCVRAVYVALERGTTSYAWLASPASKDPQAPNRAKVLEDLIEKELAARRAAPTK